jgi:hypothetical protein
MYILAIVLIVFLIMAVYQLIYPRKAFMFGKRRQFKGNVEPSNFAIFLTRLSAIFAILIILLMFYMFFFFSPV